MRKLLSIFFALAMCLFLSGCPAVKQDQSTEPAATQAQAMAPDATQASEADTVIAEDVVILYTNDIQAFENSHVEATNSPLLEKYPGMLLDYSAVTGSGRIVIEPNNH